MHKKDLLDFYSIILWLNTNLNDTMIENIFTHDSQHMYIKWVDSNYNLMTYLSSLDHVNLEKILTYAYYNYNINNI
jgi:hypothetical protein